MLEETEKNKKVQNCYVCSILKNLESIRHRVWKREEETFKNLGLVAAQCNDIGACAYSLKIFTIHTLLYLLPYYTWSVVLRPLFIFRFDKWAQNDPVWGWLLKWPLLSSFEICACRFVFRSGSLDTVGGDASLITRGDTSNRYSSGLNRHFCLHPKIRNE